MVPLEQRVIKIQGTEINELTLSNPYFWALAFVIVFTILVWRWLGRKK